MSTPGKFPNHLAAHLERRGMKPADVADAANISRQLVHKFTSGRQRLTKEWAERLAPYLQMTWQELLDAPRAGLAERGDGFRSPVPPGELHRLPEIAEAIQVILAEKGITLTAGRASAFSLSVLDRVTSRDRRLPFEERLEMTMSEVRNEVETLFG